MPHEERAIVAAHIPLALRRELLTHAEQSERTLSGEIRRGLDFYASHEYGERPPSLAPSTALHMNSG